MPGATAWRGGSEDGATREWSWQEGWYLPSSWNAVADVGGILTDLFDAAHTVGTLGACALPGVPIRQENFVHVMWQAVHRGFVSRADAMYVETGLIEGFTAGIQRQLLKGQRVYRNYPPAEGEYFDQVVAATQKRVAIGRTLQLVEWASDVHAVLRAVFGDFTIFPMGCEPKALEPGVGRPTDDHTKTGTNDATDMTGLQHTVQSEREVAWFLSTGMVMRVSDVDGAFTILPVAVELWPFFFFRTGASADDRTPWLFGHVTGDFGTRGFPGVFHKFFSVFQAMARSVQVLTLPMAVHVDDCGLIGCSRRATDQEMERFQKWGLDEMGVAFKALKDRLASQCQLMVGFWWCSFTGTITLEERRLQGYLDQLFEFAGRSALSLADRQQLAGRMQRAARTLPPAAACLISNTYSLMSHLRFPWQRRRTTAAERGNIRFFHDMLDLNMGQGHYSFEHFEEAGEVLTDASRSRAYTGGGFVSACGSYAWWRYGTRAAKMFIDYLEGDTVVHTAELMGHAWRGKWVPWGVDNQAWTGAAARGSSQAQRLVTLLKRMLVLQVQHGFIARFYWLSSADNFLADDLSRDRVARFLTLVYSTGFWPSWLAPQPFLGGGHVRHLDPTDPLDARALAVMRRTARPRIDMAMYAFHLGAAVLLQAVVRGWLCRRWYEYWCLLLRSVRLLQAAVRFWRWRRARQRDVAAEPAPAGVRVRGRAGLHGGFVRVFLLFAFGLGVAAGARDSANAATRHAASITYARTDIWTGLPPELVQATEMLLDNRLAPRSMGTVRTAVRYWREVADAYGWDYVIATDDPHRGAYLTAYVHKLMSDTSLVASSIANYVWGLCTHMQLQHQADPRMGVLGWPAVMQSMGVLCAVAHEPRRMLPLDLLEKMAEKVDVTSFQYVQAFFLILLLTFTFSRSECPCPKNFTGPDSWDDDKHWMVRDIMCVTVNGVKALKVRFKGIKQDPRIQRPTARGDGTGEPGEAREGGSDWSYVGDVPGSKLSILYWYFLLASFYPVGQSRGRTSPFFLAKDRVRPLTYSAAMADFKFLLALVTTDLLYGLHSLRVLGYNLSKAGNGEDLTVAHGLWFSEASSRYARFSMDAVLGIPAGMLGLVNAYSSSTIERALGHSRLNRDDLRAAAPAAAPAAAAEGNATPAHVRASLRIRERLGLVDLADAAARLAASPTTSGSPFDA